MSDSDVTMSKQRKFSASVPLHLKVDDHTSKVNGLEVQLTKERKVREVTTLIS